MMKKVNVLVLGALIAMGLSSCIKDGETYDPNAQYEIEKPIIEEYVTEHFADPEYKEIQGYRIWFEIVEPGELGSYQYKIGQNPNNPNQSVIIPAEAVASYEGRLVSNNSVFESKEDVEFVIPNGVIAAWQLAFLPDEIRYDEDGQLLDEPIDFGGLTTEGLQPGSVIRIVTPSVWAYRNTSPSASIPANSPLYFEITVSEIKDYESNN